MLVLSQLWLSRMRIIDASQDPLPQYHAQKVRRGMSRLNAYIDLTMHLFLGSRPGTALSRKNRPQSAHTAKLSETALTVESDRPKADNRYVKGKNKKPWLVTKV